jgi:hypothetical protein
LATFEEWRQSLLKLNGLRDFFDKLAGICDQILTVTVFCNLIHHRTDDDGVAHFARRVLPVRDLKRQSRRPPAISCVCGF